MKTTRLLKTGWLQIVFLALPFVLAAVFWPEFPARVATHWNIHGQPNGWMGKEAGLLILPVVNLGIWALFFCLPWIDPKIRANSGDHGLRLASPAVGSVLSQRRAIAARFPGLRDRLCGMEHGLFLLSVSQKIALSGLGDHARDDFGLRSLGSTADFGKDGKTLRLTQKAGFASLFRWKPSLPAWNSGPPSCRDQSDFLSDACRSDHARRERRHK
jgi:hypothetical protein